MMSQNLTSSSNSSVPPPPQLTPTMPPVNTQLPPSLTQTNIPLPPLPTITPTISDLQQQNNSNLTATNNLLKNKLQASNNGNSGHPSLETYIKMEIEEEPKYQAVNGVVLPPCVPNESKRHRNTNQLQYLLKNVIKAVLKHHFSWPFSVPVDSVKLKLPDYHNIIPHPMDINTIKRRLENCYYWSAQEAIHDFKTMFQNCYVYNKPGEDVVFMGQTLEKVVMQKLIDMPSVEEEIPMPPIKGGKGKRSKKGGFHKGSIGGFNKGNITPSNLNNTTVSPADQTALQQKSPLPSLFQTTPTKNQQSQSASSINSNNSNNNTTLNGLLSSDQQTNGFGQKQKQQQSSIKSTNNNNNSHSTRLSVHSPNKPNNLSTPNLIQYSPQTRQSPIRPPPPQQRSSHNTASFIDNQSPIIPPKVPKNENLLTSSNSSSSKSSKKGVKRKVADTTTSFDYPTPSFESISKKMSTRRESGRTIKKPIKDLPYTANPAQQNKTKKIKLSEQMKYCNLILKELFSKKHNSYAWPFMTPYVFILFYF